MNRKTLIALLALPLAMPLALAANAAGAETSVRGTQRADAIDGRIGGKLSFECTGRAQDVLVVRLGDGTVFAAGTLAQLKTGISRGVGRGGFEVTDPNAVTQRALAMDQQVSAEDKVAGPLAPATGADGPKPGTQGGGNVWNEAIDIIDLRMTIPSAPGIFGRGSVTLYRGAAVMDTDRIDMR
ncbi:MAG: hypothetical protein RL325_758 [Planctomycetota bacterium]